MKKRGKPIDLKKMTISKIQIDDLNSIKGGDMRLSLVLLKNYLISWIVNCS